ncbi:GSCFA domain-containing protein [Propylenella binzhouense]|uniref:GSCFA family protein n=1 Tax=Propylenella binzhouense TaxID=2555902 RepID=A0A964T7Y0_9HYPH|nr:GSCFA domain-containing protein [Propylenella binzhouense]MYZ50198.1 GSCFA family protein [Propylenella binzhouense]
MNPYSRMPSRAFWRSGVAAAGPLEFAELYEPRFPLGAEDRISTAGSCFAQHIGRRLASAGFKYQDFEPGPPLLPREAWQRFGYGIYSARYGNIYTARQLLQTFERAFGEREPCEAAWISDKRVHDPFRPSIEPEGFADLDEFRAMQDAHFSAVRRLFEETDIFVFTFGLTEAWRDRRDGSVFPVCPGTVAGTFDDCIHEFHNFAFAEVYEDMRTFMAKVRAINPRMRYLFTVSPVPLTATASGQHVLSATTYSKSVLRAVAGQLAAEDDDVDYFPSYEIVTTPTSRGLHYRANMREVAPAGVDLVMKHFFDMHPPPPVAAPAAPWRRPVRHPEDVWCDEAKLELMS